MRAKILIAITSLIALFSFWLYKETKAPWLEGSKDTIRVTKNATLFGIIANLYDKGYIKDKTAFKIALLVSRDTTPAGKDGAIKVGFNTINQEYAYTISKQMTAWQLADVLLNRGRAFDGSHGAPEGVIWEGEVPFKPEGSLKGKLTISPLCPVEPCTTSRNPYADLQLTLKGESIIQYPRMDSEGNFELDVPVGEYELTLDPCKYPSCQSEFPKSITIKENETTYIEINLDTGIR